MISWFRTGIFWFVSALLWTVLGPLALLSAVAHAVAHRRPHPACMRCAVLLSKRGITLPPRRPRSP